MSATTPRVRPAAIGQDNERVLKDLLDSRTGIRPLGSRPSDLLIVDGSHADARTDTTTVLQPDDLIRALDRDRTVRDDEDSSIGRKGSVTAATTLGISIKVGGGLI
jgi:hypothetical protein